MDKQSMAKVSRRCAAVVCGVLLAGAAQAVPVVDTGTPAGGGSNWSLDYSQWLASEFHVAEATTVTGLEGYFGAWGGATGTVTIALHGDNGSVPGDELFAGKATFGFPATAGYAYGWAGVTGVDILVAPGDYWIAFESRTGDASLNMLGGAPEPLSGNAHRQMKWNGYYWTPLQPWETTTSDLELGVRIQGTAAGDAASTVPEPASCLLLGTGLAGLAALGRRRGGKVG